MHSTRRRILATTGVIVAFAGCLGDNGDDVADDSTDTDDADSDSPDDTQSSGETVLVGPDDEHRFEPETLTIDSATTVQFVWEGDGHNIVVTALPDGAEWEGVSDVQDNGDTHDHMFAVEGTYEYHCGPHAGEGMEGVLLVGEAEEPDDAEEDDGRGSVGY